MTDLIKRDQRCFISSSLQKISGDDTQMVCNLGNTFRGKRILLQSFTMDNAYTNMYGKWKYLDIQTVDGLCQITCEYYITKDDFINFLNDQLAAKGFSLILTDASTDLPSYDQRLKITGNEEFGLVGKGWEKLGFSIALDQNDIIMNNSFIAGQVPDFSQSSQIFVRLDNISNACMTGGGVFSFSLINNSQFSGRVMYQYNDVLSNQQIILNDVQGFHQIAFTLLDSDLNKLENVQGNNMETEIIMILSFYID